MTDRELKRLSRAELMQLLLEQTRETKRLEEENETLKAALEDRHIRLEKLGSIAEAALCLGGVFEAAEAAADIYVENAKRICGAEGDILSHRAEAFSAPTKESKNGER